MTGMSNAPTARWQETPAVAAVVTAGHPAQLNGIWGFDTTPGASITPSDGVYGIDDTGAAGLELLLHPSGLVITY